VAALQAESAEMKEQMAAMQAQIGERGVVVARLRVVARVGVGVSPAPTLAAAVISLRTCGVQFCCPEPNALPCPTV
jgi:hypothetical protein